MTHVSVGDLAGFVFGVMILTELITMPIAARRTRGNQGRMGLRARMAMWETLTRPSHYVTMAFSLSACVAYALGSAA